MLSWNRYDHVCLYDLCCGIQIFGATGSGKTSTTTEHIAKSLLCCGAGAIFFAVKPDDPENYLRIANECGRGDDVVMFGPKHDTSLNFVQECLGNGGAGLAANVTYLLSIVSSMTMGSRSQSGGGVEGGEFWAKLDNRAISSFTQLLMCAGEPVTTVNLERLLLAIPRTREQVGDEQWQSTSYLWQCLRAADETAFHPEDREQVARLADYFLLDLAQIGEKMRSTIQTSVGAICDSPQLHPTTIREAGVIHEDRSHQCP